MTPRHPFSTATPNTLEAIKDAAVDGFRKGLAQATPTHGTTPPSMSDVEKKGRYHACENDVDAPGFKLWAKYETLNKKFDDMKTEQTKLMAVLGFWKWALPIIVAAVGAGAALGGLIVGHKAQASPAVDVAAEIQALRSEVLHMRQP